MVVLIDLTPVSYHLTGIERYAVCITEKLIEIDQYNKYILLFRDEVFSKLKDKIDGNRITATIIKGDNKAIFNLIQLPAELHKLKADIYLFLAITSPILFSAKGIITTIHDMAVWDYPKAFSTIKKIYFRMHARISLRKAKKIITVSEFSKGRIHSILNIDEDSIHVVPSAIADSLNSEISVDIYEKYHLPPKYILTLSTMEPRKNLKLLVEAFSEVTDLVDYDLVLVGRKGWGVDDLLSKTRDQTRIHATGYVKDEDVSALYKNALCFVFPTAYEGFGLPPVESLAMGTPVISSDAASMHEVLRNQAIYFQNEDKESLKKCLVDLYKLLPTMPRELDEYQKTNYSFNESAKKILSIIGD